MSQTSYDRNYDAAFAGMKADARYDEVISRQAEGAIDFGRGVVRGTDGEKQCKIPASTSDVFLGLALHRHVQPSGGVARYEDKTTVDVMRKGQAWVKIANVAVSAGDEAYLETGTTSAGVFTNATSGTTLSTGCTFDSDYATSASSQLARLDINEP